MTRNSPVTPPVALVHRIDVLQQGWSDDELRRSQRRGDLTKIRRGSYARPDQLVDLNARELHRLEVVAATRRPTACVVSHASAAALWAMPLYEADLSRVHFIRPGADGGRVRPARHDHAGTLSADEIATVDGILTTSVARTLVDLARSESTETAVVAADFALHHFLTTPIRLAQALGGAVGEPGIPSARRALMLADGRSESPGESLRPRVPSPP